jgi:hypothetical protein
LISARNISVTALLVLLPAATAAASPPRQRPPDTLAEVGPGVITSADLLERIDLMPFPGKERNPDRDSLKVRALQSLVAERLLAHEATLRGIGSDSLTMLHLGGLERAFVRDELYKQEVARNVNVSAPEIEAGMRRYAVELRVILFRCSSEEFARTLSRALGRRGTDIDSLSSAGFERGLLSRDSVNVNFGLQDESLEEPAYSLTPARRVSSPVNSPMLGWVVLFLVDRGPNPSAAAQSITDRMITVKKTIQRRKAQSKGIRYMASVLDVRKAEADRTVLGMLGEAIYTMIAADTAAHRVQGRFMLTTGEVDRLEEVLRADLRRPLVGMPERPLTLGDALQAFRIEPFSTPSLGRRTFAYLLNESVKRIAMEEFLAREGYRKNLQESAGVRHDVGSWRDSFLAHLLRSDVAAPGVVTEEEEVLGLIEYARLLSPAYEVNVREIFTDSLPGAGQYREMLAGGDDMASLARKVSKRPGWAERGGESGWFFVRSFPDLGVRALLSDTARLVGPVALTGGFSIFRVLGKRVPASDSAVTVDSLRRAIHDLLRSEQAQRNLDRFIAGLARKFGVTMHYDRLKDVTLFAHNIFTRRYLGFGGMMNAAPLLNPEWEWVAEYERSGSQVP